MAQESAIENERTFQCPVCLAMETLTFVGNTPEWTGHWKQVGGRIYHRGCKKPSIQLSLNRNWLLPDELMGPFLKELMRNRRRLPSQLAAELGISPATIGRWLYGKCIPSPKSCQILAEYSGVPLKRILYIAGHWSRIEASVPIRQPGVSLQEVYR